MADKEQQNPGITTNTFTKGMVKDYNETFVGEGLWTHARNAVNNSHDGQIGVLGNEPANMLCAQLPYTLIGSIHLNDDQWAIYTTDDINSEIGIFDESECSYKKVVNDPGLNFNRANLITGTYRKRYDCERLVYWDDGINPTRVMDIDNPPYMFVPERVGDSVSRHYKLVAGACGDGTGTTIVSYKDTHGALKVVRVPANEVYQFATWDKASVSVKQETCKPLPCYTTTVSQKLLDGRKSEYRTCMSIKEAREIQFPGGKLEPNIKVIQRIEEGCECSFYDDNDITVYSLTDITDQFLTDIGENCILKKYTDQLDTERLRLIPFITHPCLSLQKGKVAGTLPNGSYQVVMAYTVNENKISDYIGFSDVQSLFSHENLDGSLEITVSNIDTDFDEFELVILSTVNGQTTAKRLGIYYTTQKTIYIDQIQPDAISIPISNIPLRSEPIEKTDAMYTVSNYLLRVGTYSKFQFNYQLQANKIKTSWVAVKYPEDYYRKGGNNTTYMRDEQYAFFIRWIYNTGERSASFHIPGRQADPKDLETAIGQDAFETRDGVSRLNWQVKNTASVTSLTNVAVGDGGLVIGKGLMGYWESTEIYPPNKPEIWGPLCGAQIRHHKFPDVTVHPALNHVVDNGSNVIVLGVQFENITHPVDNYGNDIPEVVGYEILRGSREGQKSIVAKGMFSNMREYTIPGNTSVKGLYQNYPYNDLRADDLLTSDKNVFEKGSADINTGYPLTAYKKDHFSFHSPDTTFSKPFLSFNEAKIETEIYGEVEGVFSTPYKHPKFKLLTNFSSSLASIVGTIGAIGNYLGAIANDSNISLQGTDDLPYTKKLTLQKITNHALTYGGGGSFLGTGGSATVSIPNPVIAVYNTAIGVYNAAIAIAMTYIEAQTTGEQLFRIMYALVPRRQFGLQYDSHAYFNNFKEVYVGNRRRKVDNAVYVSPNIQGFDANYQINNLYRSSYVAIKLGQDISDPTTQDTSRFRIGQKGDKLDTAVSSTASAFYGSLKVSIPSQYGQLENIKQLPVSTCIETVVAGTKTKYTSSILFGGDAYINRFTEKNPFFFFNSWLMGEPDETEVDYRNYGNIAYPRFWVDSSKTTFRLFNAASNNRHLDERESDLFYVKKGYFYLFFNGVKDFFCESEVNTANRDWEDVMNKRHYDPHRFTDYKSLFRSDFIKDGNYYKYDYSLSVSKLYSNYISWGSLLPRDYDPKVAETCYVYRPNKVIYSLPQSEELKKDNWRLFLTNNYKSFQSRVTAIKPINKTGALFMMNYMSPMQFVGVDTVQTDIGTKLTVGDGGLFNQPLQNLINTDDSYEYGSNQSKFSSVSTPYGVTWVSQNQGKIFNYAGSLEEISKSGMKWWFAKYLPSELLKTYPNYPLFDNPIKGVGVQVIYDNTNEIIYITKKDFKPKRNDYVYDDKGAFFISSNNLKTEIALTNSEYFEDASWTISYDPKSKVWLSFHDWEPTFMLPGKSHFMSVNKDTIWKHNVRTDEFCNFYNIDYPFEVEFISATGQQVNSLKSVEYLLEAYKYSNDGKDKFHVLDENFDQAIIYNSEQISGLLQLEIKPKGNPFLALNYPIVNADYIKILFAKEENKYRFNQFFDITKNRGEFDTSGLVHPPMFDTKANGYEFSINPTYVNYKKSVVERKKFRHNVNRVFLKKHVSNDVKFLFKIFNQKLQSSTR